MFKPIDEVLKILQDGNQRFIDDLEKNYNFIKTRKRLIKKQNPFVIILSCSDSRVAPEIIFDTNLGSIFDIRITGNIVNKSILESIQYALDEFKCSTIIVLGHESCGAIEMTLKGVDNNITNKIKPIINESDPIKANIVQSMNEIKKYLNERELLNKYIIYGAEYYLETGKVEFL